jgi:hypothetical protein
MSGDLGKDFVCRALLVAFIKLAENEMLCDHDNDDRYFKLQI